MHGYQSIPIYGWAQYPHVGFVLRNNPPMDTAQIIAYHLKALMAAHPERDTLAKVSKASKVGFGTVQRARNGDGNLTVHNLALIAASFHRKPQDFLVEPLDSYPPVVPISPTRVSEPPVDERELLQGYRDASDEVREILLELARKATKKKDFGPRSETND
jgi:hypothetical protein